MVRNEISSGALVCREKDGGIEFLLLARKEGFMDFPKGHIEKGETPEIAAIREIKEETGLTCTLIPDFKEEMNYHFTGKNGIIKKKVILYLSKVSNDEKVIISHEHENFLWAPFEKAIKIVKHKNQKRVLKLAMEKLRNQSSPEN